MHFQYLFILTLFIVFSLTNSSNSPYIIGGTPAKLGQFPYQVSIQYNGFHECGGSILSSRWVLTSAHCINPYIIDIGTIVVGTLTIDVGTRYGIAEYVGYDKVAGPMVHDIALIKAKPDIIFNDNVKPIEIYKGDVEPNLSVIVSGWGLTESPHYPPYLMYANFTTISNEECEEIWNKTGHSRKFQPYEMCTTSPIGMGACIGDSGGALQYEGKIMGMVAFGVPCATIVPDGFQRVPYYTDWIESVIDA